MEDYKDHGERLSKGAIYTRKGDTNTPKTGTADVYDTELLWKRRFGLVYNPSQRAKQYLKDIKPELFLPVQLSQTVNLLMMQ